MELSVLKRIFEFNARRSWNPLGFSEKDCGKWAEGLGIPGRGEKVLYTGCLYQMAPRIKAFSELLRKFESLGHGFLDFALKFEERMISIGLDPSVIIHRFYGREERRYAEILRKIAIALREAGVDFAYLREEPYNGVLYYDMGLDGLFEAHLRRVVSKLKEAGAEQVITVDPHSTYMLSYLVSEYFQGFDLEVVHYTELLEERSYSPKLRDGLEVSLHDPCYLARWKGVTEQPRRLLERAGIRIREPEFTKEFTGCCGGPIESLFPTLSSEIAVKRFSELSSTGSNCFITLCPICLLNLEREARGKGIRVLDFAEVLL